MPNIKLTVATVTRAEGISEAERWLSKSVEIKSKPLDPALDPEEAGAKRSKLTEMSFKRALAFEDAAFDGRA